MYQVLTTPAAPAPTANTFYIAHAGATSTGVTGGSKVLMEEQIYDEYAQVEGANCHVTGWAYRCNNFIASKRQFIDLTVENARVYECGNGIFGGTTGTAPVSSHGHRFYIKNCHFKRVQGRAMAFYGSRDMFVRDCVVEDFGGLIRDNGNTQTPTGNRIGGIELQSCIQARVQNLKVRQNGLYQAMAASPTPVAVVCGKAADYSWGTELAHIHTLVSVDVDRDIVETAECSNNFFELVRTAGNRNPTSSLGAASRVTRFPSGAQDP
jgi:hypothetical protein